MLRQCGVWLRLSSSLRATKVSRLACAESLSLSGCLLLRLQPAVLPTLRPVPTRSFIIHRRVSTRKRALAGGVIVRGSREDAYRLNLHLRTATRILLRLGRFEPSSRSSLEHICQEIPWSSFLCENDDVQIRVGNDIKHKRKSHDQHPRPLVLLLVARFDYWCRSGGNIAADEPAAQSCISNWPEPHAHNLCT